MPNRIFAFFIVAIAFAFFVSPTVAQRIHGVAAVVNDQPITALEVQQRLRLVVSTSGVEDSPRARVRLLPAILDKMIDEKLQLQEAKRLKITVSDSDISTEIRRMEQNMNLPAGGLQSLLARNNVSLDAVRSEVRARVAWRRVVNTLSSAKVSEEELESELARTRELLGKPERLLAEIFLRVDSPNEEAKVREFAQRLMQQIAQGANFVALAQAYSQSASAARGGDLGWVSEDQLDPELAEFVKQMKPRQLGGPFRTKGGFHIILMRDFREGQSGAEGVSYDLAQIIYPLPANADDAATNDAKAQFERLTASATTCEQFESAAEGLEGAFHSRNETGTLEDVNEALRPEVAKLKSGEKTPVLQAGNVLVMMMVCKIADKSEEFDQERRNTLRQVILERKLANFARRHMRELRDKAIIDVRLQ